MNYFVIHRCEDELHAAVVDKVTLEKRLNENYYGVDTFLDRWPDVIDLPRFPDRTMIIMKAEVIVPKATQRVTMYEL